MFLYGFECDRCGRRVSWFDGGGWVSKERAKVWARKRGWTFGKRDKCPHCNGNFKKMEQKRNEEIY